MHIQHGTVLFKEAIASHGEHREKQAFEWNCLEPGLLGTLTAGGQDPQVLLGKGKGAIVLGITSCNSKKRKKTQPFRNSI